MGANDDGIAGFPADDWDAAKDFLLDLARQPENIKRLATLIGQLKAQAVMAYAHKRRQFDSTVMGCGHARHHWLPKDGSTAEQFIANTAEHGYCVVCKESEQYKSLLVAEGVIE